MRPRPHPADLRKCRNTAYLWDIWRAPAIATQRANRLLPCTTPHVTTTTVSTTYIVIMKTKRLYNALRKMRRLTEANVPFSITYISCNMTDNISKGEVTKGNVMLRTGLSTVKYKKGRVLIGFTDFDTDRHGWFYLPLLLKVNNINIYD